MARGNKQSASVVGSPVTDRGRRLAWASASAASGWSGKKGFLDDLRNIISLTKTDNGIDAIDLIEKLRPQSLAQTTGNDDFLHGTAELTIDRASYCFERFGFGWGDKTTRIYDNNVSIISLGSYSKTRAGDVSQHPLAVNDVLRTA
jgi:hypothetical protein